MNYIDLNTADIANGPGVRVTLFVSGCTLRCKGCHNPAAWQFDHGTNYTLQTESDILYALAKPYIKGLSILGGEPYDQLGVDLLNLVEKTKSFFPGKDIWVWTGHEFEEIRNHPLTKLVDVVVCGRFIIDQRDITFKNLYRGSTNQRVIDVQASLTKNRVIPLAGIPNNEI